MEFHEKLQELRKQKGLTQEQLAEALYVSRTAISKWESDRGYPNIESLKAIAKLFSVSVDALLSGEELLSVAEEDHKQKQSHLRDLVFGLLDLCAGMFLFLPLFGEQTYGVIENVSLLSLFAVSPYLKLAYYTYVIGAIAWGVLTLALQNCSGAFWLAAKGKLSLLINVFGVILFVLSRQPYPAIFLFVFLIIKALIVMKKR